MQAPSVRYEDIVGLIAEKDQDGPTLRCKFRCTISGESIDSVVQIVERGSGMMQRVQDRARRSVWYSIRRAIFYRLRRMFGYGIIGRLISEAGAEAFDAAQRMAEHTYSDEQLQAATVRAFQQVSRQFRWDAGMGQWVWAGPAS